MLHTNSVRSVGWTGVCLLPVCVRVEESTNLIVTAGLRSGGLGSGGEGYVLGKGVGSVRTVFEEGGYVLVC